MDPPELSAAGWRVEEMVPAGEAARSLPRIVQVVSSLQVGGLQSVVAKLVTRFDDRFEHLVMTPSGDGPLRRRFPAHVPVIPMADIHRPDKWNTLRMARLFRRFRPDIVHTRNWTCVDAIVGARLAGVRIVIQGEHGRDARDPEGRDRLRRGIRHALAPLVTRFVPVSRDLTRWLIEDVGIPRGKITQICNGVDSERFRPGSRVEARRALGLPEEGAIIGTVGRLDPVKDYAGLIRAFATLPKEPRATLVMVGDGPCRPDLEQLIRLLGLGERARLVGERDDVPLLLRSLDLFVLSSVGEGIANAILEAMATGLPVVATRVGGNPELVADGVNGLLVEASAPAALAAAMHRYLADPSFAEQHGRAGRARAESEFSIERMFAAYGSLYAQLLASRTVR